MAGSAFIPSVVTNLLAPTRRQPSVKQNIAQLKSEIGKQQIISRPRQIMRDIGQIQFPTIQQVQRQIPKQLQKSRQKIDYVLRETLPATKKAKQTITEELPKLQNYLTYDNPPPPTRIGGFYFPQGGGSGGSRNSGRYSSGFKALAGIATGAEVMRLALGGGTKTRKRGKKSVTPNFLR